jgi:hypothetical protein
MQACLYEVVLCGPLLIASTSSALTQSLFVTESDDVICFPLCCEVGMLRKSQKSLATHIQTPAMVLVWQQHRRKGSANQVQEPIALCV